MKIVVSVVLLLLVTVDCYPKAWIQYGIPEPDQYEERRDYLNPFNFGSNYENTRVARKTSSLADIFSNGIFAGFNFFDRAIPSLRSQNAIIGAQEASSQNFTRPRRQEDIIQYTFNETIVLANETTTISNETETVEHQTTNTSNINSTDDLKHIISQLNNALVFIKKHNMNEIELEPINSNTTTEDLVKHISACVEEVMKTKDNETKSIKIKNITKALDILLNRVARSAKNVIEIEQANNITHTALNTSEVMARLVQYVTESKRKALLDKIRSGGEVSSAEVDDNRIGDDAFILKLRGTRQEENNLDADIGNDAEEITQTSLTTAKTDTVTAKQEEQSSSSSSEEEGNLVTNLISSFLGSLSKPDGGVDVDAIVGLIGGLSVLKDDGTYDFSGLTDTLQSFLGGDEQGGGSDVGAFLGGLIGAILQGSANPQGALGTGRLTGNLVANLLPGLSAPAPLTSAEVEAGKQQPQGLDSGSFLAGILSSMLGASSGTSSGGSKGGMNGNGNRNGNGNGNGNDHKEGSGAGSAGFFNMIKNGIFKSIVSIITSLLTSSSGSSSKGHG